MAQSSLGICQYFGFLFMSYCVVPPEPIVQKRTTELFNIEYQWSYINFTWPSPEEYRSAIFTKRYIPENSAMAGIKFYKDKMFIALPRIRPGTPVTLAVVSTKLPNKVNPLLKPFPSWETNVGESCTTLQSVQSMEIDRRGIMWVLDGMRVNDLSSCPTKLVLLDLNQRGRIVNVYVFRNEISSVEDGFLNDIVIDESDGGYAYITDNSKVDPGLIIFSRQQGRVWKIRDKSMFAEIEASNFTVDGVKVNNISGIDGIALSPLPKSPNQERLVYYTSLIGYSMYAISTQILKNEGFCKSDQWRRYVKFVGKKNSPSDGLIIDNKGDMYFGLLSQNGIGKWNIFQPFSSAQQIYAKRKELIWPDSFAMDSVGNLYVLANGIHKFFDASQTINPHEVKFRVFKTFTGNKNYMFSV